MAHDLTIGDPRPARRVVDRTAGIEKVKREGRCRACGHKSWMLHRHHLVGRGVRGDDVEENIVPLCGSGTQGCHGALHDHGMVVSWPSLHEGRTWHVIVSSLRANLRPEEIRYIIAKKSEEWLNQHYPRWED